MSEAEAISFRPIVPADEPFLRALYGSTRQEELAQTPWTEEQKEAFLDMQFAAQHKYYQGQFTGAQFSVVELRGEAIGRLYIDRREDEIRVLDIALLPEHRGQGIGYRLMRGVLDEGEEAGKPVRIHVERFNPAMRLYERLGFQRTGDTGVYYLMEWTPRSSESSSPAPAATRRVDDGGE